MTLINHTAQMNEYNKGEKFQVQHQRLSSLYLSIFNPQMTRTFFLQLF